MCRGMADVIAPQKNILAKWDLHPAIPLNRKEMKPQIAAAAVSLITLNDLPTVHMVQLNFSPARLKAKCRNGLSAE